MPSDLPNAHGLAVDWVSRNLFWTSYDTNKKQINVARLDGSFKNAVVQVWSNLTAWSSTRFVGQSAARGWGAPV